MKDRILLIDPDPAGLASLAQFFEETRYEIDEVRGEESVWQKIPQNHFDLIFLFLSPDNSSRLELIRELRARVRMPCQIFVIGPNDVSVAVQSMHHGARYYWTAPMDPGRMRNMFRNGAFPLDRSRLAYERDKTLLQIIKEIALTMELDGLVNILIDSAMELTGADGGALLFLDEKSNSLTARAVRGLSGTEPGPECFGFPEDRLNEILLGRKPVFLHPIEPAVFTSKNQRVDAIIVVPICWKDAVLGEMMIAKFAGSDPPFSSDDFKVLSLLGEEIAAAVYNAITHYKTKELTIKDDLTEAYNRRYFDQYLEDEFFRARRYDAHLSLIFFDVDNLKEVNVKHGHIIGSKILQEIAHRMILTVRGIDKVVRYGGDEFCIVLPETDVEGAYQVADRIRHAIASRPFRINEIAQVSLTGSFGIASFPDHASTKEELVRQADKAMFAIKNQSKNAIAVASEI